MADTEMPRTEPLSRTKLFVPQVRTRSVARPRLLARLDEGITRKLTLISAPAGAGKTTLLSAWCATDRGRSTPLAWLSLDEADDHPGRFWLYLLDALEQIRPGVAGDLPVMLTGSRPALVETVVRHLAERLAALPQDAVLVLDDYHAIAAEEIHRSVALLLDLMPPQFHLVLITRVDPPLPLTRLRVRGELTEIRLDDLRFTPPEVNRFLEQSAGLQLEPQQVALLAERTEGWIAGLQLAALSLQGLADVSRFVQEFAGTHRYVADYLLEEVLRQQPPAMQAFLLDTAVLDRLSGPLCDAVTDSVGGQAILEELERRNLFLIPLDHHRQWYRYHHLFAEMLQQRLEREFPGRPRLLHQRASGWYETAGLPEPAVNHALLAGEHERAIRLATAAADQIWHRGENRILLQWLEAVPAQLGRSRPDFLFAIAWALVTSGRLDEAASLLLTAEEQLDASQPSQAETLGGVLAARAHVARLRLELEPAVALSHQALAVLPPSPSTWRGLAVWNLGAIHQWTGEWAAALSCYEEARGIFRAIGDMYGLMRTAAWRGAVLAETGRLPEALADCRAVLAQTADQPMQAIILAGIGDLLWKSGELSEAERVLRQAIDRGREGGLLDAIWQAYLPLARVMAAQGDDDGALACLQAADDLAPRVPWAMAQSTAVRAALLQRQGNGQGTARLAAPLIDPPSGRELEVLRLLAEGASNEEIARRLFITLNTVKKHVANLLAKLAAANRTQAVARGRELGLL